MDMICLHLHIYISVYMYIPALYNIKHVYRCMYTHLHIDVHLDMYRCIYMNACMCVYLRWSGWARRLGALLNWLQHYYDGSF